jgi:hypothetical protein
VDTLTDDLPLELGKHIIIDCSDEAFRSVYRPRQIEIDYD